MHIILCKDEIGMAVGPLIRVSLVVPMATVALIPNITIDIGVAFIPCQRGCKQLASSRGLANWVSCELPLLSPFLAPPSRA